MVLDSSAIVAIHLRQPGHERLIDRIDAAEVVVVGVADMPLLFTGEDFSRTDIAQA
jgi:uncharacterized protein with PIN domain